MRGVIAVLCAVLIATLALPVAAQEGELSDLERAIKHFRDNYGDSSVRPDADTKLPAGTGDGAPPESPFGGDVGLDPSVTDPFRIDGITEFRFNFGGQGFPDSTGGPADTLWQLGPGPGGATKVTPFGLPDDAFWVPPSATPGPPIGDRLGINVEMPGLQQFGGEDVIVAVSPDLGGSSPRLSNEVIVRGGFTHGPIPLDDGCGGNYLEFGTADALAGGPYWPADFAPNDIFKDATRAHVARCTPGEGWSVVRFDNTGEFFNQVSTQTVAIIGSDWWVMVHRVDELEGSEGHRTFQFLSPADNPFQEDTTAFFAEPMFPTLANAPAPLVGLAPFSNEVFDDVLTLEVPLMGTWEDPEDGSSGCNYYASEYTALVQVFAPSGFAGGTSAPVHGYELLSGQTLSGTVTANGELGLNLNTEGEGYSSEYQFKGQAVDLSYTTDDIGECNWVGTVTSGYDEFDGFFTGYLGVAAPTTTTEASSDDETTETTEASDETTSTTLPGGGNLESGSFREWVPIVIAFGGLVLFSGGFWVYYRTRQRTPGGATTGGGSTDGGGKDDPPPTTPEEPGGGGAPPTAYGEEDDDHTNCDWAMYFNGNLIRPAKGHECCRYDLDITTDALEYETVSKGRQDGKNPHGEDAGPDERLRLFDYDLQASGIDMLGWAASRTGPAGRQDWMHGLGDPQFRAGWRSTDEGEQHPQERPLEEPVDAGVSVRYHLETTVYAELTPGCEDTDSHYDLEGSSDVWMAATAECTNGAPGPECPVEASTSGFVDASMSGDLDIPNVMKAATYPDELERKSPEGLEGPVGGIDSHDHASRPRVDWADDKNASARNHVDGNITATTLTSRVSLDSGQIVPIEVWDTTERVTTDIQGELELQFDLDAHTDVNDCGKGCEGHGECDCAPAFSLKIVDGKGKITVDVEEIRIERTIWTNEWVRS
ncbi:MAG: hypothetical protein HKN46_09800 [Acidimicrobiia bacterium]|nr:hypothetical protein [Acidimicrobiia bacterium]